MSRETYGKGKLDALQEFYDKGLLNTKGMKFYSGIEKLKKKGWFDNDLKPNTKKPPKR